MSAKKDPSSIPPQLCQICSAPAECCYLGVISCRPCKSFFKRNGGSLKKPANCHFDDNCEISIYTRHLCQSCRLKKCSECGMTENRFRPPQVRSRKRSLAQITTVPTLNLLQNDQSSLSNSQWTLLNNLFHCYNESSILPFTNRLTDVNDSFSPTPALYRELVDQFLVSLYETVGNYLQSNDDLRHLSSESRSSILQNAANNVTCMSGAFIMQHCSLYRLESFLHTINAKYGTQVMNIHQRARRFIDLDTIVIKLAISLFAFSENTSCYYQSNGLTDSIPIYHIQNKYVEVIWKYLLYKYGHQNAVRRFLNLTLWLTSMNLLVIHVQTLGTHLDDIHSVVEQTELTFVLDEAEEIIDLVSCDVLHSL